MKSRTKCLLKCPLLVDHVFIAGPDILQNTPRPVHHAAQGGYCPPRGSSTRSPDTPSPNTLPRHAPHGCPQAGLSSAGSLVVELEKTPWSAMAKGVQADAKRAAGEWMGVFGWGGGSVGRGAGGGSSGARGAAVAAPSTPEKS